MVNTLFSFRLERRASRASVLVIFCSLDTLVEADLWDCVNADISTSLRPDEICFVVRENAVVAFRKQIERLVEASSEWRVDPQLIPVMLLGFDRSGRLSSNLQISGPQAPAYDSEFFELLKRQGAIEIFIRRDGLLKPGRSFHYIHPSKRHSRGFLRAANVMISGPEVTFLAMSLLKYLDAEPQLLWVDTSSIAAIAYAVVALRQALQPSFSNPAINSFSSYGGVDTTPFDDGERSLVLISATTSGNLARRIARKGFKSDHIVILFSVARNTTGLELLCDLSAEPRVNPDGRYSATEDFEPDQCPMCREGSRRVRFVGDQFLADAIVYEPYVILASDAPHDLAAQMKLYAGRGAFLVKADRTGEVDAGQVFIDVSKLLTYEEFNQNWQRTLDRFVPQSTSVVVRLRDSASSRLAEILHERLQHGLNTGVALVTENELETLGDDARKGSVVVVDACTGSGNELQSVSRSLRDPLGSNARVYIIAFSKHSHTERHKNLIGDLRFNGPAFRHEVVVLHSMTLPVIPRPSPWASERMLLTELTEHLDASGEDEQVLNALYSRLDTLGELAKGSETKLFWNSPTGEELQLRQTFAFWPDFQYDSEAISQGDVFATIAGVLENLRTGTNPKLQQTSFYQSLIAPACFGRFNDGIIQASLLRAALPQELHYEGAPELSAAMAQLIRAIVYNCLSPKGEAATEFMLAVATKRLTLTPADLQSVLVPFASTPPHLKRMMEFAG